MRTKTIGVFYDGISSLSQEIELIFNQDKSAFTFESQNKESNYWELTSVGFDKKGKALHLYHGNNPIQIIKITDSHFIANLNNFRTKNGHLGFYYKLLNLGIKFHLGIALFIFGVIGLCYVYIIPWVAEKSVVLIPDTYDDTLGNTFFEQNTFLDSIDVNKTKALNIFAKELNLKNTKKLKFTVIDSDIMNAFALPDGSIVVYTGILDSMKSYDELVGLLGHEVAHVNNRHSMKMLCRNLSGYLFVSTILGDVNGIMAVLGENANTLQSLSFSREFEKEADIEGFKIVTLNKINPKGMSTLFKRLQKESVIAIPEFLSSHPVTEERIRYIDKLIKTESFHSKENPELKRLFEEIKK